MSRTVRCQTEGCGQAGIVRDVPDTPVARGLVTRPPLICAECGQFVSDTAARQTPVEEAVTGPPENAARRTGGSKPRRR